MDVSFVRPKASDLLLQVFGRSLHPELFEVYANRRIQRDVYEATIQITDSSHVIVWRSGKACLSEVAAASGHPLPKRRRLLVHRMRGEKSDSVRSGAVVYQVNLQTEHVEPEVFWHLHEELAKEQHRPGLFHQFRTPGRFGGLAPISYLNIESRSRSLLIQAFHTFPDEFAIVKTQSLFEVTG